MKKCFTINPLRTKEEFETYIQLLKEDIYQAIEIFYPYQQGAKQLADYTECVNYIKNNMPNVEIVLHLPHGVYNGLCLDEHLNAGSLEIMKAASVYAASFGIKKLTLHLGHIDKSVDRKFYVNKIIPILQDLCDFVKKNNQYLMVENMPADNELGYSPMELKEILDGTNRDNIKYIHDCGHAHVASYPDTDYIYLLKDYLFHLHHSDNDSTRDEHKEMGLGTIDFNAHFKALKDVNYQELYCMEVIYHSSDDLRKYALDFDKYKDIVC